MDPMIEFAQRSLEYPLPFSDKKNDRHKIQAAASVASAQQLPTLVRSVQRNTFLRRLALVPHTARVHLKPTTPFGLSFRKASRDDKVGTLSRGCVFNKS